MSLSIILGPRCSGKTTLAISLTDRERVMAFCSNPYDQGVWARVANVTSCDLTNPIFSDDAQHFVIDTFGLQKKESLALLDELMRHGRQRYCNPYAP